MLAAAIVISLLVLASLTADRDHGSGPLRSEAFGAGQEAPLRRLISASGAAAPRTSRRRPAPRSHPAYRLLHGVDVSHWNHSIRWKRVRASGQTFAIMKATEGRKQVDRTYARNRRRAMRAGMIVAAYHFAAAWPLELDETAALAASAAAAGFPVGHASAQLAWRGLRSRPVWRVLLYSADEPPSKRGLVELDAVDGEILGTYTEDNPEDWSAYGFSPRPSAGGTGSSGATAS